MIDRRARIEGGLVGLLVGDALGVPYEFHAPSSLPPTGAIEMEPPGGFRRAHPGTPPGTWSDDGAHALALLATLLEAGGLDVSILARRLLYWHDRGELAVDARVFDIGIQTRRALENFRQGALPLQAGPSGERDNGNGSLMRVLPLALWHRGSDESLAADAEAQSRVTHGHLRARLCCALYCLWARRVLDDAPDPWSAAVTSLRAIHDEGTPARRELDEQIRPDEAPHGTGSGYVVDCLHSARLALEAGGYEEVVRAAILLGHDTDTTACVAGGIAGLRDGVEAIPRRWREALRGREILQPLLSTLLARG